MKRAKTCAVVMNSTVDAPGCSSTSLSASAAFFEVSTKLLCVRTQPFGRPIDPDV